MVKASLQHTFPSLVKILVDKAYNGSFFRHVEQTCPGLEIEIVKHDDDDDARNIIVKGGQPLPTRKKGFRVLRLRWVVERTFAWMGLNRRLAKDYEATTASSETWIWMAMAALLVRRLAK